MSDNVSAHKMRGLANWIQMQVVGYGFALFVFELNKPGIANYISNVQREDMIKALEETLARLKGAQDFPTPDKN